MNNKKMNIDDEIFKTELEKEKYDSKDEEASMEGERIFEDFSKGDNEKAPSLKEHFEKEDRNKEKIEDKKESNKNYYGEKLPLGKGYKVDNLGLGEGYKVKDLPNVAKKVEAIPVKKVTDEYLRDEPIPSIEDDYYDFSNGLDEDEK